MHRCHTGTAPTTRNQKVFVAWLFSNLFVMQRCTAHFGQILIRGLAAERRNIIILVSVVGHSKRQPRGPKRRKGWELCLCSSRWEHLRWPVVWCPMRSCSSLCLWKKFLNKRIFKATIQSANFKVTFLYNVQLLPSPSLIGDLGWKVWKFVQVF